MKDVTSIVLIGLLAVLLLIVITTKKEVYVKDYDPSKVDSLIKEIIILEYKLIDMEKAYLDTLSYYGIKDSIRQYNYEKDKKKLEARRDSILNAPLPTDTTFNHWMRERFPEIYMPD